MVLTHWLRVYDSFWYSLYKFHLVSNISIRSINFIILWKILGLCLYWMYLFQSRIVNIYGVCVQRVKMTKLKEMEVSKKCVEILVNTLPSGIKADVLHTISFKGILRIKNSQSFDPRSSQTKLRRPFGATFPLRAGREPPSSNSLLIRRGPGAR